MVLVNALTGTATAWVLVRYDFPGRGLVNALIDLPFAVPTVVTGVMLVVLYRSLERGRDDPGPVRLGGDLSSAGDRAGVIVRDLSVRDPERAAGADGAGSGGGGGGRDARGRRVDDVSPGDAAGALALDPDRVGAVVLAGRWASSAAW